MTAPVFIVEPGALAGDRIVLSGAEGRHAVSVRRLRIGEDIVLTDGAGTGAYGTVAAVEGKDHLEVAVTALRSEPAPRPRITVVQALPKGDRGELAVETMTETGIDAIVPWAAARCVTQWRAERGAKALAKWRSTAREAAKQSRRLRFPDVDELMTTRQVAALLGRAAFAAVLHEEGSEPLASAPSRPTARSCSSSARRAGSPRRSWTPSPRRAPSRTGWGRPSCVRPRRAWRLRRCCWGGPGAGVSPG